MYEDHGNEKRTGFLKIINYMLKLDIHILHVWILKFKAEKESS